MLLQVLWRGDFEMIPEPEREALARLSLCANRWCINCKYNKPWLEEMCQAVRDEALDILCNALDKEE